MPNTRIINIDGVNPDSEKIKEAAQVIRKGGIVAVPTDTVYGLAADSTNRRAIDRLYEIKNRSKDKPFSLLIADTLMLGKLGIRVTDMAGKYITKFWPGALTIIMEDDTGRKIGLRLPGNDIARELIRCSGVPLACPSANLSGEDPSDSAIEVKKIFDELIDLVIDDGIKHTGRESSVIDLTSNPPRLLREGAISRKELDNFYDNK